MRLTRILFVSLSLVIFLSACKKEYDPVPEYLDDMYPIVDGKYRTYYVIDTLYNTEEAELATTYYKRELTDGSELDLLDRDVSKLWIYISPDSVDSAGTRYYDYQYADLWTQYKDESYAERIEGNIRYLVLRQPPVEESSWNGNLYNSKGSQTYRVLSHDSTVTIQGQVYNNCVVVEQQEFRQAGSPTGPLFIEEYAFEIYAPGIGKIARYYKFYQTQEQSGQQVVDPESRVYIEELVGHNYY